jgi:hypothetical protein
MSAGIQPVFLRVHPRDIALAKFLIESYEDIAIVRTLDRREAVIVVLAVDDFVADVHAVVEDLCRMVPCEVIPPPPDAGDDWLLAAMDEEG